MVLLGLHTHDARGPELGPTLIFCVVGHAEELPQLTRPESDGPEVAASRFPIAIIGTIREEALANGLFDRARRTLLHQRFELRSGAVGGLPHQREGFGVSACYGRERIGRG